MARQAGWWASRQSPPFVAVSLSAEFIYQLTGANLSSPQTAQLDAIARAPTINKWVNITTVEATAWTIFLTILDGSLWPVVGAGLAWTGMYGKYRHAISAGLAAGETRTRLY